MNKGTDQLRGYRTANLHLYFCKPFGAAQKASLKFEIFLYSVMILSFWTDTVQTQIRLLLEEQSDQGLHCLLFHLHHLHHGRTS